MQLNSRLSILALRITEVLKGRARMSFASRVKIVALIGIFSISSIAPAISTKSTHEQRSQSSKCSPYIFLGMSGSGQKGANEETGIVRELGPEVASLFGALNMTEEFKGKITYDPIEAYRAIGIPGYSNDVWKDTAKFLNSLKTDATNSLMSTFISYANDCPESKFIVAGFSQGAYAAHYLITELEKSEPQKLRKILGVVLLANPANPKQGIISYFDRNRSNSTNSRNSSVTLLSSLCTALKITTLGKACQDLDTSSLPKVESKDLLPSPTQVNVYSYYQKYDLVADTSRVMSISNLTREVLSVRELNKTKSIVPSKSGVVGEVAIGISNALIKGKNIHTSYCPASGEFAPKNLKKRSACNSQVNREFLEGSVNYIRKQLSTSTP